MFGKLKSLFKKTEEEVELNLKTKIKKTVTGKAILSEEEIDSTTWNFQLNLMQNDVAMEVAESITAELKEKLTDREFSSPKEEIRSILKEVLLSILVPDDTLNLPDFIKSKEKPVTLVFFGINGTGKTTTMAKIAKMLKDNGLTVVAAAGDTFRAGAIEQLETHMKRVGVKVVKHQRGADAAAVIYDAREHAKAKGVDVVLADTSGRMQSNSDLIGEMQKIIRVNSPDLKIFIGDALTGNDAVDQAREFNENIGIDCSILTKCDASKGGAALSITYVTNKPIIYLGVGQGYDDLIEFVPEEFVDSII